MWQPWPYRFERLTLLVYILFGPNFGHLGQYGCNIDILYVVLYDIYLAAILIYMWLYLLYLAAILIYVAIHNIYGCFIDIHGCYI